MRELTGPARLLHAAQLLRQHPGHPARVPAARRGRPRSRSGPCWPPCCRPTWGIYSGYELCENVPVRPGSEEYMDSEKYQYRPRDWDAGGPAGLGIAPTTSPSSTGSGGAHPALHRLRNLRFHPVDQPELMCFSKRAYQGPGGHRHWCWSWSTWTRTRPGRRRSGWICGAGTGRDGAVHGHRRADRRVRRGWANYVRLDPATRPAHIFTVRTGAQRPGRNGSVSTAAAHPSP